MKTIIHLVKPFLLACVPLCLMLALGYGPRAITHHVLGWRCADERLLDGLRMRDREAIETALAEGASPDAAEPFCRHTALIIAASSGDLFSMRELLDRAASLHASDRGGMTALSHAACWGKAEAARELIRAGAEINHRDGTGLTPLALAAINGHEETIRLLLSSGANVEDADLDGCTPLMLASACAGSSRSLILLLIDGGGDPARKDRDGRTALDHAVETGNDEIEDLLRVMGKSERSTTITLTE